MTTIAVHAQTVTRVEEPATSLPNGTVVYADGQLWKACAGHEKSGLRWQQANGWGASNDRYMDKLFADCWGDAGSSRVIQYGGQSHQSAEMGS
ncbi:hypothetical protein AB0F72_08445 [Actinoplanes sp. NPDC023936]|uniref:hypothetical protein n=1 Tax=Actinoplanes sp. NPDC023936 TaxID=3154910 RepID=UPI0033F5428B